MMMDNRKFHTVNSKSEAFYILQRNNEKFNKPWYGEQSLIMEILRREGSCQIENHHFTKGTHWKDEDE
ncbi:hypothetical protein N4X08_004160 [Salmonella enterica]|nr:hypothetical protein [Salmonella enterica]